MDDDRRRELESYAFETQYWMTILDDLREAHGLVGEIAGLGGDALVENLHLVLSLAVADLMPPGATSVPDTAKPSAERIGEILGEMVGRLGSLQARLFAIAELSEGRVTAIRREADLPEPDEE